MRLPSDAGVHLTYCTNVHPSETWPQVRDTLARDVRAVKARVCPDAPFSVGLRLSARAVAALAEPAALAELRELLATQDMYVVTLNGFPHGAFHGQAVKEQVYLPDWRSAERVRYSDGLAEVLSALLPDDAAFGSVSTVPGAFKQALSQEPGEARNIDTMVENLIAHVAHLTRLRARTGKRIVLALEPEPCCFLETTAEVVDFFERHLRSARAVGMLAELAGLTRARAASALEDHLGVCIDTCHAAVEFEDSEALVDTLERAAIPIAKLQLSSALRIDPMSMGAREGLLAYLDHVYLHQVVERRGNTLTRYTDLKQALEHHGFQQEPTQWRVHFHIPVFIERMRRFGSTQAFLREMLALQRQRGLSQHLEVETYTWDVLPAELQTTDLTESIARELRFCLEELATP